MDGWMDTIELVLPSAHTSPQPKQQINWFICICTAHGRMSSGIFWCMSFPLIITPFAWGIWALSNTCLLGSTERIT